MREPSVRPARGILIRDGSVSVEHPATAANPTPNAVRSDEEGALFGEGQSAVLAVWVGGEGGERDRMDSAAQIRRAVEHDPPGRNDNK